MTSIDDPFVSDARGAPPSRESHRYSSFDTQLFSLDASSPAQAKRALEAHLSETERRLEEASKLGTALIEQQKELEDKLKEVEQQQEEGQIGPDLRRKLADLEKEYNEIGRETARAFLGPKRLAGGDDGHLGTPSFDQKSPLSPVFFAGQATNSPSKVSAPSRKQRNQPSSRVHDIEFATEISTSLLAQVRQLQALLAEREEALKTVNLEKSRLELEAEGYAQRIRALDESEERYKDENWALETRTHELMSAVKDATDREGRLNSNLGTLTNEKNAVERELEELKQQNAKLLEDQATAQKATDSEIHLLRRNLNSGDVERLALQKKLDELNSQNQELAKAVAMRLRNQEAQSTLEVPRAQGSDDSDDGTPENSPPPSPNKFTPRRNHLETETLRSSLGHAHRMIQNLKSTIHREKTEKIELKRMLQEARDEVEQRRREGAAPGGPKRQKTKTESSRKSARPDLLGAGRRGRTEVEVQDTDWEDNAADASPSHKAAVKAARTRQAEQSADEPPSDAYHTAAESDAFETANEREAVTESDAFQTGVESMADDSDTDELTETEDTVQRTPRGQRVSSLTLAKARDRSSWQSTASTSADEEEDDAGFASPTQVTPKYRPRKKRSVLRKIRPSGEAPMASGSRPSSARESPATSFTQAPAASEGQSLFAELADLEGDDGDDGEFGPPMHQDPASPSTPRMAPEVDFRRPSEAAPKPPMVDSGVMTEPWEVISSAPVPTTPQRTTSNTHTAVQTNEAPPMVHSGTQWFDLNESKEPLQLDVSPVSTQETLPTAPKLPELSTFYAIGGSTVPVTPKAPEPPKVSLSGITSHYTEPVIPKVPEPYAPSMNTSSLFSEHTLPVVAKVPEPEPAYVTSMNTSTVFSQHTLPVTATTPEPVISKVPEPEPTYVPSMNTSSVFSQHTLPVAVPVPEPEPTPSLEERSTSTDIPELTTSSVYVQQTEPIVVADEVTAKPQPDLSISLLNPAFTEPVAPRTPEVPASVLPDLSFSAIRMVETLPVKPTPAAPIIPAIQYPDENAPPAQDKEVAHKPTSAADRNDRESLMNGAKDTQTGTSVPLAAISGNAGPRHLRRQSSTQADQGAQTILSSKQIDQILMDRISSRPLSPPDSDRTKELGGYSPYNTPKAQARTRPSHTSLPSNHRRPGSAASQASSVHSHPPLPADHREAILAAEKKSIDQRPASPAVMGPPLAPASAYRNITNQRPRTPNDQGVSVPMAKTTTSRTNMRRESQVSRRSSVSSFASELEERFNMNPNNPGLPHGYVPGTDPRMIQAITQTMIGEFLWKYTRKTVSGEISSSRHRRYFWIHPYTRTLYWSEQDPQTAGKAEGRTKSVPIEGVRVVADDNPYPPGLHCKSLEIISPGRRIRFTATTSQRHETWFNALSYLLVRNPTEGGEEQENITLEDIDEFNPGFRSRSRNTARMSVSSSQSRTLRSGGFPQQRAGSALSMRRAGTPGRNSPALSAQSHYSDSGRQGSTSRLSTIFNSTIKGSFGRKGPGYASSSYQGSVHTRDSEEDLRQMMERQERDSDRLENVRACCDGKHDVSSLSRTSRFSPRVNRIHSHH